MSLRINYWNSGIFGQTSLSTFWLCRPKSVCLMRIYICVEFGYLRVTSDHFGLITDIRVFVCGAGQCGHSLTTSSNSSTLQANNRSLLVSLVHSHLCLNAFPRETAKVQPNVDCLWAMITSECNPMKSLLFQNWILTFLITDMFHIPEVSLAKLYTSFCVFGKELRFRLQRSQIWVGMWTGSFEYQCVTLRELLRVTSSQRCNYSQAQQEPRHLKGTGKS